jgi:glycosyltransferase involved in cell wall biosynthesis
MPRASVPGTIVGRLAGVPIIVNQEHGWSYEGKRLRRFLDRHVVARGDAMLAVSQHDRRQIIDIEGIPPRLVRVLPNGIEPMPTTGRDIRAELGGTPGTALIGAVGRLAPEKAHADLIRAVASLRDESRDLRCVIAGEGPEEHKLNELIRELNVHEHVRLLGPRLDVHDIIRALDVAVLCSKNEGSPLALIEYMACGAPIVATAVGGVPEMIEHGVHGLLVRPNDPAGLAGAIGRLLDDPGLAGRLGGQARQRQRSEFDLGVVVTRLEHLYLELCDRARPRSRRPRRPVRPDGPDHGRSNSDSVRITTDCQV